jgi:hypothetical protein
MELLYLLSFSCFFWSCRALEETCLGCEQHIDDLASVSLLQSQLSLDTSARSQLGPSTAAHKSKASSAMYSHAEAEPTHYKLSAGEFHNTYVRREDATTAVKTQKCKNFYKADMIPSLMVADEVSQLFRPATEVFEQVPNGISQSLPAVPVERMATYEDLAFPKNFHGVPVQDAGLPYESWCEMLAIRTSQRPVKAFTATSPNGTKLMMPPIWKVA